MHCQNLAGAVEVVLLDSPASRVIARRERILDQNEFDSDLRQLTGCTSPKTTVTFTIKDSSAAQESGVRWTDVYVLDASGSVLGRADFPKLSH